MDMHDNTSKGVKSASPSNLLPPPSTEVTEPLSGVIVPDPKYNMPKAKPGASPATAVGAASKRLPPRSKTRAAAVPNPPRRILKKSTASDATSDQSESLPPSASPQPEFVNDSEPIEIDDDEEGDVKEDGVGVGSKRKLTSAVWKEFKRVKFIYVPAPHTADVIYEQLYESLVKWNLDENISTLMTITNNKLPFGLVFKTYKRVFRSKSKETTSQQGA
ncbi:hypothetical protein E2562_010448 [Oryza meyeriana var. granulata]|uniref:Uncharacterized protein n=1 Tax=Oryza meyeriana var. granulata TaxID=110450 RepID=A0A6G1F6L6_9ORYZ|nr:hypothetical protein E2562_010448 [Oryza meyeriana var. granulata]